jgi:ankyrin repeat protein
VHDCFERERLHQAAEAGDLPVVENLVSHGCEINAFDELGKTPLHYAVLREHFAVIEYLLRHGADVNAHDERVIGNTPLGEAAGTCSVQLAQLLLNFGADPSLRGWMQLNALDRAKVRKRKEGTGSAGQAIYQLLEEAARTRKSRNDLT